MSDIRKKNKQRAVFAFVIIVWLVFLLAFRMAWIQIVKADEYREKARSQQTTDMSVEADRGIIYDRNGKELASSATSYSVWIRPNEIDANYKTEEKKKEISEKLALALDMKSEKVLKKFDSKSAIVNIARYVEKKKCDKVRNLEISGLEISEGTKRYYPMGTAAAKLLGSVTDDSVGRTGIEAEFDNYLSGISGRWIKETDLNGDTLSFGSQKLYKAKDGYNLHLTIDEVLQNYAEKAVKTELVLSEIAKAEGIKATDEEVSKEIETLAAMYGLEKDALIADVRKNGNYERFIDETNYRLVNQKTIDLLVKEAKVK